MSYTFKFEQILNTLVRKTLRWIQDRRGAASTLTLDQEAAGCKCAGQARGEAGSVNIFPKEPALKTKTKILWFELEINFLLEPSERSKSKIKLE